MKLVLKDPKTGFYFKRKHIWTNLPERARIFHSKKAALKVVVEENLGVVKIKVVTRKQ